MTADLRSPLTKEAGALKEQHEVELAIATPLFDIQSYVEEFGASIEHNATHGSDAPETAAFELAYFFPGIEFAR